MKKLFLILVAVFTVIAIKSQEKIEVPLHYSTSGYLENASSNFAPVVQNTNSVLTPSVNAEMEVNASGALVYALPIEIFKGINNLQPNIGLGYNSQSGNGQAGWGWNVMGLSMISRGGKSKDVDGVTIGPQFNASDPFYLDGQRLIETSTNNFATEKFSKIKINKYDTGEYQFIIKYTDGKIAKYKDLGFGQYYISTIIDAFNNEIHYTYQIENNVPRVTKISYGGTSTANDLYYINFLYKNREKSITIYRNNTAFINSKILYEINTGSTTLNIYRKYALTHDLIEDGSVERVRTINVSNENNDSLKPLNFNYNTTNQGVVQIVSKPNITLNSNTNGLGSATIGNFLGTGSDNIQPVFQVRSFANYAYSYKMKTSTGEISGMNSNAGTKLFSGKILNENNKITENDQLISVDYDFTGTADLSSGVNSTNQNLIDNIKFEIRNVITNQVKSIIVPIKGGVTNYNQIYQGDDPYWFASTDDNSGTPIKRDRSQPKFIQGDFNNDGLVDFLIISRFNYNRADRIYLVEIGKHNAGNSSTLTPTIIYDSTPQYNDYGNSVYYQDIYPLEFDGDGIPELLFADAYNSRCSIFKVNTVTSTLTPILTNQLLPNFNHIDETPLFFGDFNGDGITDLLYPQKVYTIPEDDNSGVKMGKTYYEMQTENLLWWKFTGTGTSYIQTQEDYTQQKIAYLKPSQQNHIKTSTFWQKFWDGTPDQYEFTRYSTHNIIIADFNNDGRSDIISLNKIGKAKYNSNGILAGTPVENLGNTLIRLQSFANYQPFLSNITNRINFYENKSLQGGNFQLLTTYPLESIAISPLSMIVPTTNSDYLNTSKTGVYIFDALLGSSKTIAIDNSNFLEKQIQEVNNGTQVIQKVEYRNMFIRADKSALEKHYAYTPLDQLTYPYYVHQSNPSLYFVSKINTIFDGKSLTKEYRYENGVQHLEGKGFLGFQKTYSSDAYESELKNGTYVNLNPYKGLFWNIETHDPKMENAVVKSTYGGLKTFFTENNIINQKFDRGNNQYLILSTDEVSLDLLKGVTINKKYEYDINDDLKLKRVLTDYSNAGSSITDYTYQPSFQNGEHHFYGKFASTTNTAYRDGLSFSTREEMDYFPNGNISVNRKFGNQANAPPISNSYTYDSYGNVLSETLTAQGIASLTTSYEYDATHRYNIKTTTPDGLFQTANINALGRVISDVSSLGLTTSYTYDTWGNITELTDFLNKVTTISKSVADPSTGGVYNLHKQRQGSTESIVTFDKFDREIQAKTQSINGKWLVVKTEYDIYGKTVKNSEPFFEGETIQWNTSEYDELNRPIKNKTFTGKTITTCYEKMKVTVDDGDKKTSKTLDAMGNVIRHQDHGGVLAYSYYPNGSLKETNYEGIKTLFEIDGWGNKTKLIDPSAGTFTYEYDILNRITKENSPKGYTLYTYDSLGRPLTENTYGNTPAENTNITKTYTYNGQTKLPETITGQNNGKSFTYTTLYDQYYRIKGKKEETPEFNYESDITFDSFGKADQTNTSLQLNNENYTSTSSIKNIYDGNGILIQQDDLESNSMVWHLSDVNARGQSTNMEYGNGFALADQYDPTNHTLFSSQHLNTNNGKLALDIEFNYDINKGVLLSRHNKTFDVNEEFTYDKLNRLLSEIVDGIISKEYTYDFRGRITSNTDLGKYNYNNTDYKLQGIDYNDNGASVNANRGFAQITYNAFRSPNSISLQGKDNLSFEYNILQTRYSMSSEATGKQKFYSSDFAYEITKEQNGNVQIISFLTGDPYSSNYIKKEIVNNGNLLETGNYYLHRDNLGSILAISNTGGDIIEKRFFDAWGNLKALTDVSGITKTDPAELMFASMFIDRGYTGHEHLSTVGLINMNARVYDPILRKFLSADNLVSDPYNTQAYDRYSYVLNNPLLYIDPSGNDPVVVAAIMIGAAIIQHAITNMINGVPFWYGIGKATASAIAGSAMSFGIGSAVKGITDGVAKAIIQAGMHGVSGGLMSAFNGGTFISGFAAGAISSIVSSGVNGLGTALKADSNMLKAMVLVSGGISGGISSTIAGGKFIDGLKQGLITAGLNHVAHYISIKPTVDKWIEAANYSPTEDGTIDKTKDVLSKTADMQTLNVDGGIRDITLYNIDDNKHGDYDKSLRVIKINTFNNVTLRDYVLTTYHELRHHYWYYAKVYNKMRDGKIGEGTAWSFLQGKYGFNEYQAHKATFIISGGLRSDFYESMPCLDPQSQFRYDKIIIPLERLFIKSGGFYPK